MSKIRFAATLAVAAALLALVPVAASAKDRSPARPKPVPAPVVPANTGLLDVTNFSVSVGSYVNASTGVRGPIEASASAIVGATTYQKFDEVFFNVRRVGGTWDRALDFPYVAQPVSFGGYNTIMLSTARSYASGAYEVRVAARQGTVWTYDEVLRTFTI